MMTTATKMAPVSKTAEMMPRETTHFLPFRSPAQQMERVFDRFFDLGFPWLDRTENFSLATWAPSCDVLETDDEIIVKAELPEVKKEDVTVTFENNLLTLRGERKFEAMEKGEHFHRVESRYGEFMRSFRLPQHVDGDKINAEFKDGMLKVNLPKRPEAKPKQIEIKVK